MSLFKRLSLSLRSLGPTSSAARKPRRSGPRRPMAQPELTPDLITHCEEALTQRLQQAKQALQQSWPRPRLSFTQRGKAAGTAHLQRWEIRLNPVLLVDNLPLFLHEVIAHELAHLLVFARHGRCAPHGKPWQAMMSQVFDLEPRVTHQLDISKLQGPQFVYRCACREHQLSVRRHNKVLRGQSRYLCRHCGQPLQLQAGLYAANTPLI